MLPSNLKITNEDKNYVSQTQKFQFDFPSNEYEEDDLNLGGAGNHDLHVAGKLTYGSQKCKNHIGTEIELETSVPDDTKLVNSAQDTGVSSSAFCKR